MGFPSPASDYVEDRISLDAKFIKHPSATYYMRAGNTHHREGIIKGALLVIDCSLNVCDGSLLICCMDGEFRIKRYRSHPRAHLVNLENGKREEIPEDTGADTSRPIFVVITYIITHARSGEFDDCPLM